MTFAKAGSLQSALNGKSQIDKLLVLSTGSEHYRILIRLARDLVWDQGERILFLKGRLDKGFRDHD
jgi:hypothetical protein